MLECVCFFVTHSFSVTSEQLIEFLLHTSEIYILEGSLGRRDTLSSVKGFSLNWMSNLIGVVTISLVYKMLV